LFSIVDNARKINWFDFLYVIETCVCILTLKAVESTSTKNIAIFLIKKFLTSNR